LWLTSKLLHSSIGNGRHICRALSTGSRQFSLHLGTATQLKPSEHIQRDAINGIFCRVLLILNKRLSWHVLQVTPNSLKR